MERGRTSPGRVLAQQFLYVLAVRDRLTENDTSRIRRVIPGIDQGVDNGLVTLNQEELAVQVLQRVAVLASVSHRIPVDVVDEEAVVDGREISRFIPCSMPSL